MKLKNFFKDKGYDISEKINWEKNIKIWDSWYKGKVANFHDYYIYNGQKKVKRSKKSFQGAKKVCEDWADLLFNEKVTITLGDDVENKKFESIWDKNNGNVIVNSGIEKTFALGFGAFVVSIDNMLKDEENSILDVSDAKTKFEFVRADKIIPLSWENGDITECAFITNKTEKGINYVYISMHIINESGNYEIHNYKFEVSKGGQLGNQIIENNFEEEFDTKSNIPWFIPYKPNICNNIDDETPFGISIYGNSIDTLKALDNAYNEVDNEVILGRRRTFVSEEMMDYSDGEEQLTFDPEDISIYRMPKGFNEKSMIQNSSDQLRTDALISTVQFHLNVLSSKVGFGQERYKFENGTLQTATAVISENSDMFRTIKKHELLLEKTLQKLITAICYATNTFGKENIQAKEINIMFDDSIIEDKGAEQIRAQTEVASLLRSKKSYMEKIRGLADKELEEEMKLIQQEQDQTSSNMFDKEEIEKTEE